MGRTGFEGEAVLGAVARHYGLLIERSCWWAGGP